MQRQKKIRALMMSVPLFLFMTTEQRAVTLPPLSQGQDESQAATEAPASPSDDQTAPAQSTSADKAAGGKKAGASRKRPRGLAKKRPRRKSVRTSAPALAARRLRILKKEYAKRTHHHLVITSFGRTPYTQARAIRHNLNAHGTRYVLRVYRGSAAIRQIVRAYKANRGDQAQAQKQMTRVIVAQVAKGVYVSDHMRWRAVDIRSRGRNGAKFSVLKDIAQEMGGNVFSERDHFHFKLV